MYSEVYVDGLRRIISHLRIDLDATRVRAEHAEYRCDMAEGLLREIRLTINNHLNREYGG